MVNSDLKLFALYAIIVASLILRISIESTGYTSPDSLYYLEVAENLIKGNGLYHSNNFLGSKIKTPESQTYLAIWPVGYPILIAAAAYLFNLPVLWASKVVNFIFLGLSFGLFRKMNKDRASMLALPFCAFTFLEVYSFTWSEAPFLYGVLLFGYTLNSLLNNNTSLWPIVQLFFTSLFLFLLRYIGGFSVLLIGLVGLWFFIQKNYRLATKLFLAFAGLSLFICFYLYINYLNTGYLTGMERPTYTVESAATFFSYLCVGLFNAFFIIKNYYFRGEPFWLFFIFGHHTIIYYV